MNKPQLFIVAGPNGSGKSLFSATITQLKTEVFDGDKHLAHLKKHFPEIGSDVLLDRVNDGLFPQAKEKAISAKENFAFETNFVAEDPTYSMRQFRDNNYEVHLIFIGMNTIEECIQRVSLRVKAGGHKVPEASIVHNFKTGYKNLYKFYHEFDSVTLINNPISTTDLQVPVKLLTWTRSVLFLEDVTLPAWASTFVEDAKKRFGATDS